MTSCAGTTRRGNCRLSGRWKVDGDDKMFCRSHAEQSARRLRREHIYASEGQRLRRVPLAPRPPHQRVAGSVLSTVDDITGACAAARDEHDLHLCRQAIIRGRHFHVDAIWTALRGARRRIELVRLAQIENARLLARETKGATR